MADNELDDAQAAPDGDELSLSRLTLEQALLAPLDSILKAQLHSARSFLNLLLQLGYPHDSAEKDGHPYCMQFKFTQDGETQMLSVPALALVPISPLAVDSANFQLEMSAKRVVRQAQIRQSADVSTDMTTAGNRCDRFQRPWFLVDKPVNIEGDIVSPNSNEAAKHRESQSAIKISINVKSIPLPSGLDKLLCTLSNMSQISPVTPAQPSPSVSSEAVADEAEPTDNLN
ncbi:DUF2589 domain-containing protein [Arsukibacterium sp.]|uniref:DUF2589 domain-containing protein n=1 Tax=Arsukibacterium sp. TaxID=1977258 RepID=UPI002FDB7949